MAMRWCTPLWLAAKAPSKNTTAAAQASAAAAKKAAKVSHKPVSKKLTPFDSRGEKRETVPLEERKRVIPKISLEVR